MSDKLEKYLSKIRTRVERATKGPWKYDCGNLEIERRENRSYVCDFSEWAGYGENHQFKSEVDYHRNGDFIAHARTDVEVLLKMFEAMMFWIEDEAHYVGSGNFLKKLESLVPGGTDGQ